jgi:hypothetical protein
MIVIGRNFPHTMLSNVYSVPKHYKQQAMLNDRLQFDENELYVDRLVVLFPI